MTSKKRKIIVAVQCAAGALLAGLDANHAMAQDNAIQSGNWTDPNIWDVRVPQPGDTVNFPLDGVFVTSSDFGNTAGTINVASQTGVNAGLIVTGGTLTTSGPVGGPVANTSLIIGMPDASGRASFMMSGGTVNVSLDGTGGSFRDFIIGDRGATASGTMTGGTINAGDQFIVGIGGNGTSVIGSGVFSMDHATINTGGVIDVGFNSGSGTMTIGAGSLLQAPTSRFRTSVGNTNLGSVSTVVMTDGTINVGDAVVIGSQGASTMTMSGGVINSIKGVVLSVNGSNVTTAGNNDFVVGDFNSNAALATLNISGTAQITVGDRFGLGFTGAGSAGVVNQSGGSLTTGGLQVARGNGNASLSGTSRTTGIYNMTGGTITQTGNATLPATGTRRNDSDFIVGQADTGVGIFTQSGGAVSAQNIFLGDFDRAQATYTISGGSLTVATDMYVGSALAANATNSAYLDPTHITIPNGQAQAVVALFDVVGHGASSITIGRDFLANPTDRPTNTTQLGAFNKSTLEFDVNDTTGTTLVQVGSVADLDGAVIDLKTLGGFTPTRGQVFSLITAQSFMMTGTTLAAEDSSYTLGLVPGGNGQILQLTFGAPLNLIWNQAGGTWDTTASNQPWLDSATSSASPFTTGDTANFTDAAVGAVNITPAGVTPLAMVVSNTTGTYTFNGGAILGGSLTKANGGTLQLANASNTFSTATITGGTVVVGNTAGTASGPLHVNGALNVGNGANVVLSPSAAGVGTNGATVHSVGALNLNAAGILDLNNNALTVGATTPAATVRQYLQAGYSNGNWNGTSSAALGTGAITSTWAANDATHRTAVGYAAQPDGTTLVAATLYGDTTLKGSVGLSDYNTLAANFNKPGVWSQGDFDYDGTVTLADYNKLATNFNKSAQPGGGVAASGAAAPAAVTLTGSASPAASVLPDGVVDPGAGNVVLEANPSTGQLYLVGHDSNINSYEVDSAAGKLTFVSQKNHGGYNTLTAQSGSTGLPGSALGQNEDIWATISSAAGTFVAEAYPAGSNPAFDTFGPGLQVFDLNVSGLSAWTAGTPISDLTFKYGNGTGNTLTPAVIPIGVPEPTCLALAGIAAGGLLSRRRRTRQS